MLVRHPRQRDILSFPHSHYYSRTSRVTPAGMLPVRHTRDDRIVKISDNAIERLGLFRRTGRKRGAHFARRDIGHDAALADTLKVVGHPVDEFVSVRSKSVEVHASTAIRYSVRGHRGYEPSIIPTGRRRTQGRVRQVSLWLGFPRCCPILWPHSTRPALYSVLPC